MRFATEFMLCECFYAKRIFIAICENKMEEHDEREAVETKKEKLSSLVVFE
jgi:hypothetical protein